MAQIFINYRRRSDAYAAALLDELLSQSLGVDNIFRAGRSIPAGDNYIVAIREAIQSCSTMLVIVGEDWGKEFSRGDNQEDWVRREIEEGLAATKPIIPILLAGVPRIAPEQLPRSIEAVAELQYLRFDYRNTRQDSRYIAEQIIRRTPDLARRQWGLSRQIRRLWDRSRLNGS
ncbi:toll/interleukin-1 receptor domain-containing protein [Kitasatospora sp. NPDC058201]|uniref:toll/interleukin-1 receptor domain-containing protein n=1 Tax=unclassified Kitasatospora TaxID=2633591 RepID=UPI00366526C5